MKTLLTIMIIALCFSLSQGQSVKPKVKQSTSKIKTFTGDNSQEIDNNIQAFLEKPGVKLVHITQGDYSKSLVYIVTPAHKEHVYRDNFDGKGNKCAICGSLK